MKPSRFPHPIRSGSVTVWVYLVKRPKTAKQAAREVYTVAWHVAGRRMTRQFSDIDSALGEGRMKADQLAAGKVDAAANMGVEEAGMLREALRITDGVPLISALNEWRNARELTGGQITQAAEAWQSRNAGRFTPITIEKAIDAFINGKERAGRQGEQTYRAKLSPLATAFPGRTLETISATALNSYLEQYQDGVTRNDLRKRAVALWRWARKANHLPRDVALEIELTDRAAEKPAEIEIINSDTYGRILEFIRANHPEHLAAVVLAGFCGIRSDEIHGKRADRSVRQLWSDIHLGEKFVRVTVAKKNTPAWRFVPLCDAAVSWLMLCPNKKGVICEAGAMEKVRLLIRAAGFKIPENCFRHSFISFRVAVTEGNKPRVATEAGNSVTQIDRHYRRPVTKAEGEAWFSITPMVQGAGKKTIPMRTKAIA